MASFVLATNNLGKLAEFQALLPSFQFISQASLQVTPVEETGLSFIENALIKARHASQQTNKPALADDSGLVVHYLNGAPGVYSARFAGPQSSDQDNITKLLEHLDGVPTEQRRAYFYCAIAFIQHANDPTPILATGSLHGTITTLPQGTNGFGYDPVFYLTSHQATLAQLPSSIKNTISHRAMAMQQLKDNTSILYSHLL